MKPTPLGQADNGATLLTVPTVAATIVMVAEADFVESVTDVAVTFTVPPLGAADGAVYVVAVPLAVVLALKFPQAALPQLTDQVTCGLEDVSLLTTAVRDCVVAFCIEVGGSAAKATLIGWGGWLAGFPELTPEQAEKNKDAPISKGTAISCLWKPFVISEVSSSRFLVSSESKFND